ncbi:MAG: lysine 5,6-aminomutase subunit alpha [Holophagaceae bacterium]|nr:lysine 5,6-aminomutase subunit alpha [Holophagaceae bacterium]
MQKKLGLPESQIAKARDLAVQITKPVINFIDAHTTTAVERAALRLVGVDGADSNGVPVSNIIIDQLRGKLEGGALRWYVNALLRTGQSPEAMNVQIANGHKLTEHPLADQMAIEAKGTELANQYLARICSNRQHREEKLEQFIGNNHDPLLYAIVATGNIHEDVKQAQAAAWQGADVIAVIRTTAQSLLDYVPYGATTEGFGGTYATQENFRIMREALDKSSEQLERYIYLTNYASGLCMPEIAAMGALERLDMMLNDSMYGILFRDINMYRTFVDQKFSRMINAYAGIIINTGEDNYLTTSDAVEKAHTVLASQFINERFALEAGLLPKQMGLGHAFEIDPDIKNGFLFEVAQAQMAREIFPEAPLKYMPPTKFMTGDIFKGVVQNAMFNFASKLTNQGIHLLGMLTEAIHTPHMQDRGLALDNAKYVMNNMADLGSEITFRRDGVIVKRAHRVLTETIEFMESVASIGLMESMEQGAFADIKRPRDMGKGLDGLIKKGSDYWNPIEKAIAVK